MGIFDSLFGGGDKTQTTSTTQANTYSPWITNAQQGATGAAGAMANPFLQIPNYGVAGFTPDQMKGFDLARGVAQNAFAGTPVRGVGAGPTMATTTNGIATNANAAQVGAGDIMAQMNPFVESVISPTLARMTREKSAAGADISARSASGASFGGSGEALQRALLERNHTESVSSTVAQLMAQGFDQATATALANAQMRQQTELSNATQLNDMNRTNAAAANNTSQFNAQLGTDYALRAPTIEDGLATNAQTRQLNALQAILGTGATQQGLAQNAIDAPWTALQRYFATVPGVYDSTQSGTETAPSNKPSLFQQLLGAGTTLGTAYLRGGV